MLNPITDVIENVVDTTWPMVIISIVVAVSLRITYLVKNNEHFTLYKELFMLTFIIYILCLFQVVSSQDVVSWSSNNFIPFKEILRYKFGSRLFLKNVLGNVLLFMPFGYFASHYLKPKKAFIILFLTLITSFSIECVQMGIGRVFDIDDIMLNVVGGFFGYLVYYLGGKLLNHLPTFVKSEWFLNVVSIILLIGILTLI